MSMLIRIIAVAGLAGPAVAQHDPQELVSAAGCNGCHQLEQQMLGPSYQAVAERYRGEENAAETVYGRMREGSRGVWGDVPMPPVSEETLKDEQLQAVVDWVLSR